MMKNFKKASTFSLPFFCAFFLIAANEHELDSGVVIPQSHEDLSSRNDFSSEFSNDLEKIVPISTSVMSDIYYIPGEHWSHIYQEELESIAKEELNNAIRKHGIVASETFEFVSFTSVLSNLRGCHYRCESPFFFDVNLTVHSYGEWVNDISREVVFTDANRRHIRKRLRVAFNQYLSSFADDGTLHEIGAGAVHTPYY